MKRPKKILWLSIILTALGAAGYTVPKWVTSTVEAYQPSAEMSPDPAAE